MKITRMKLMAIAAILVLPASAPVCRAQQGRIPVTCRVTYMEPTVSAKTKGEKDMLVRINRPLPADAQYVIFWLEDANGKVVKSRVIDKKMLAGKREGIADVINTGRKYFSLKLRGVGPGDYRLRIRIIIDEERMYVADSKETVS